jgi:hypothetical protein
MLKYKTGARVGKGTYWDLAKGQRIEVEQDAILSGAESSTYFRIPTGVMLIAAPVIGLLYAICLPFISIATVTTLATRKMLSVLVNVAGKSLSFGWRPMEAYLAGKKKGKKKSQ